MSAYSDPTPYADPDLERFMIAGRIDVMKVCLEGYERKGDQFRAARTRRTIDELLDRYNAADDMAVLATSQPSTES